MYIIIRDRFTSLKSISKVPSCTLTRCQTFRRVTYQWNNSLTWDNCRVLLMLRAHDVLRYAEFSTKNIHVSYFHENKAELTLLANHHIFYQALKLVVVLIDHWNQDRLFDTLCHLLYDGISTNAQNWTHEWCWLCNHIHF